MTHTLASIGGYLVFIVGLATLLRAGLRLTALPTVRAARRIRPNRAAAELTSTDRFIRDQEHELWPDRKLNHKNCTVCGPGPLLRGTVPSSYDHGFFKMETQEHFDGYGGSWQTTHPKAALPEHAEMVSSSVVEDGKPTGMHTVMLDLDFPATLVESSTPGHHHLYIDHLLIWSRYRRLLRALADADLIEKGYYKAAVRQHATMLRPPWVSKPPRPAKTSPRGKKNHHNWTSKYGRWPF